MNYEIIIMIILLSIFIYYVNIISVIENIKDSIIINVFNTLSVLFILIFIYYSVLFGVKRGIFTTLIIWCLFVTTIPIPISGALVSVPLKNLLNIDLDTTQMVISLFCLCFIFYSYYNFRNYLSETNSGRFLLKILDLGSFSIFVVSILASISLSYFINGIMDETIHINNEFIYLIIFIISLIYYIISLYHVLK